MINIILICLILTLFFVIKSETFLNTENNEKIVDNPKLLNDYNIENDFNCYIYGCNSSRNDTIEWIGIDENNNEIFKNKNKDLFIFNNGFLNKVDAVNFSKVKKNDYLLSIPTTTNKNKNPELKINLKLDDYIFSGYLTNNFYRLQYLVYKKPITVEIENDQMYEYILVKIINNEYKIIHKLPLRQKIENLETIWVNYGSINLGPLVFTTTINFSN